MDKSYKIKMSLRLPMIISVILSFPVFYSILLQDIARQHLALVIILIFLFLVFAINNIIRKISFSADKLSILNVAGKSNISFNDITSLDGVTLGSRQYITISSKNKTFMIPNTFSQFSEILSSLQLVVPKDKINPGFKNIEATPASRPWEIVRSWLIVIILVGILVSYFLK